MRCYLSGVAPPSGPQVARLLMVAALAIGCGDDDAPADAAPDGSADAGPPPDSGPPPDAGPMCEEDCGISLTCCPTGDGTAECVDRRTDPTHCGLCGLDCGEGRGTECVRSQCVCGDSLRGCAGNDGSWCCPPREPGGIPYCANLHIAGSDCGECGLECDPARADRCDGGECRCGESRSQCEGTPEDTCCTDRTGTGSCVDTTTDFRHCGGCGDVCGAGETCVDGECM